ncbi:unnamed protein product, partial [Polarella glacialis]
MGVGGSPQDADDVGDSVRVSLAGHTSPAEAAWATGGGSSSSSMSGPPVPKFQGGAGEEEDPMMDICTLQEPVSDTILRDLRSVGQKLMYVILPMSSSDRGQRLKDWDLWGPLLLCIALGLIISGQTSDSDQSSAAFADVFVTVWVGSAVVTLNDRVCPGLLPFPTGHRCFLRNAAASGLAEGSARGHWS